MKKKQDKKAYVVLLHGILRVKYDMILLQKSFAKHGYEVINIQYPSRKQPLTELSDFVHKHITSFKDYDPEKPLNFVTHSMGGIITRYYIAQHNPDNLGRVVMLGPPNTGSEFADWLTDTKILAPMFREVFGPAGQELKTTHEHIDGDITYPLGVIAGNLSINPLAPWIIEGEHDGIVAVERTKIEGMRDHIVMPTTHAFMMFNDKVIQQALHFLEHEEFDHP